MQIKYSITEEQYVRFNLFVYQNPDDGVFLKTILKFFEKPAAKEAKKVYKSFSELSGVLSLEVDGLTHITKNSKLVTPYGEIKRICKDDDLFYIFISDVQAYILEVNGDSIEFTKELYALTGRECF